MQSCMHAANLDKLILNSVNVTIYFKFTSSPENVIQLRLQNSPYFCVFKYATREQSNKRSRTRLKTKSETWGACEASALRARETLTARFTDFFTDFEKKNRLFCSLNSTKQVK